MCCRFKNSIDSSYGSVENLKKLTTNEFIKSISDLYARLDYTHPFVDGNSRTFRTFTKQVANSAGFLLDWDKTASSDRYRDALYCARGICANNLALSDPLQANFKEYIQNMNEDISFISGGYDINVKSQYMITCKLVKRPL